MISNSETSHPVFQARNSYWIKSRMSLNAESLQLCLQYTTVCWTQIGEPWEFYMNTINMRFRLVIIVEVFSRLVSAGKEVWGLVYFDCPEWDLYLLENYLCRPPDTKWVTRTDKHSKRGPAGRLAWEKLSKHSLDIIHETESVVCRKLGEPDWQMKATVKTEVYRHQVRTDSAISAMWVLPETKILHQ